jgi:hypothetical protein
VFLLLFSPESVGGGRIEVKLRRSDRYVCLGLSGASVCYIRACREIIHKRDSLSVFDTAS